MPSLFRSSPIRRCGCGRSWLFVALAGLAGPAAAHRAAVAARPSCPLVSLGTSLGGVAQSVQPGLALAGWAVALVAALPLGMAIGGRRARGGARRTEGWRSPAAGSRCASASRSLPCAMRWASCSASCRRCASSRCGSACRARVGGAVAGIGIGWLASLLLRARRAALAEGCSHAPDRPSRCWCFRRAFAVLAQQRFDFKVREDMFAGFDGDTAAFDRAMKLIADTLAADPDHAEALVWRGDGRLFLAGQAFQRGAISEGQASGGARHCRPGSRRVACSPTISRVRVPRAAGLLPFARGLRPFNRARSGPPDQDRHRRLRVRGGGQRARTGAGSSEHGRGELLGALADGWLQLGDVAKANVYLDRMSAELPGTPYARNAALRRADPAARVPLTCLGCH